MREPGQSSSRLTGPPAPANNERQEMRVRVKVQMTGTRNGEDWPKPGVEIDLPDEEAIGYLNSGLVEAVPDTPPVETSTPDTKPRKRTSGLTKERTGL